MAREKDCYREALEDVLTFMDGKRLMTISDVSRYLQCDRRTARKKYTFDKDGFTTAIRFAREIC